MEIKEYINDCCIHAINNVKVQELVFNDNEYLVEVKNSYENTTVKKYILKQTSCFDKRLVDSLKLVHLEEDILDKKMPVLSSSEQLKIELAILLIQNVNCIVFDQFDSYFMEKELLFFKKLFKKLVSKYHKTIVFINSDLTFLFDLVDRIVVKETKKNILVFDHPTFYEEELNRLVGTPKIVEFVKYVNDNGKKLNHYIDLKELLKAIFREV